MTYKKELLLSITICIALVVFFASNVPAAEDAESSDIIIEVGSSTMIDITPASFTWTALDPGSTGSTIQAQIENIGSTNLTSIWFNTTQPAARPFGTGSNASYDAGNMVYIARESGSYYAVDRLEFNETRSLVYLTDPGSNQPPDSSSYVYGRFRNASGEYFWMFDKTSQNCADIEFYVGDVAHTKTTTGSVDFSGCDAGLNNAPAANCRTGALSDGAANWCYADINIGGETYVLAVNNNTQDRVRWSHWNQDAPGAGTASNDETFYSGTLYPGNSTVANVSVRIPYGVAQGYLQQGELYVIGSDGA